jgi:D-alanine-D-alanine ligase
MEAVLVATVRSHPAVPLGTAPLDRKLTITVLAGGPGGEREISLQSGAAVSQALETLGHKVEVCDIAPDRLGALAREVDCVFVALHGTFGEDGQVQTILERRGMAYTGSDPAACALAMNKVSAKKRFLERGLPTPRYTVARSADARDVARQWTCPVVVKPVQEGSSLCCHIVRDAAELPAVLADVIERYGECLVEDYIPGLELTVGILEDRALPPIEIRTRREFYDYEAKYVDEDTEYLFELDVRAEVLERIQLMSLAAHRALGCRDFSRVDWRFDPATERACILEINVIPGLTSHSLLPKAAGRAGISMSALCQSVVDAAVRRAHR